MLIAGIQDGTARLWNFNQKRFRANTELESQAILRLPQSYLYEDVPAGVKNGKNFFQITCDNVGFTKNDKYAVALFMK